MCGLYLTTKPLSLSERASLTKRLFHRGPDAQTWHTNKRLSLLQTRLAIVGGEHDGSEQPHLPGNGDVTAFNGELFNYRAYGGTEVTALHSLVAARRSIAGMLNGYYAVLHYDAGRNEIRLYRDPFGVMPLWYSLKYGQLTVCSEQLGGMRQVPPGSELRFDLNAGRLHLHRHVLSDLFPKESGSTDEIAYAFHDAVKRCVTHTDVGYDVAFSGGLDSSMLLGSIVAQGLPLPKAIIVVYFEPDNPELLRARALVQHLGLEALLIEVALPAIDHALVAGFFEPNPIKNFAFWRHYHVAKVAKSKVILCGEGADELGLGYPMHQPPKTDAQIYRKKISLLRSQSAMTLDRVNLAGMAHSKEYRVPFLDHALVRRIIGNPQVDKGVFRSIAMTYLGIPSDIARCSKFSSEEATFRRLPA